METTRHFTATAYVVNDGATLLHEHERLGLWLPPGGHLERDELPRDAAAREVREETGLDATLLAPDPRVDTGVVRELPPAEYLLLEDIHTYDDGTVGHQHVDFVYFASVPTRDVAPDDGERRTDHWRWFAPSDLRETDPGDAHLGPEVVDIGTEAIRAVSGR